MAKPRRVSYELIERDSVIGHPMYALLDELVHAHHDELRQARIALAWNLAWRPDVDGHCTLGKCKRAGDLDRELTQFDFIILLLRPFWRHESVTDLQRRALLDHELCHGALKYDKHGEPVEDERGRKVYRTVKHDLEEFSIIVERYGAYTKDIETFFAALRRSGYPEFRGCAACAEDPAGIGWRTVLVDTTSRTTVRRCACWVEWQQVREELSA
jgi:hypothetical protein